VPWYTVLAIYFIVWWLVFFTVLPFGIRSQEEHADAVLGTDPGAPKVHGSKPSCYGRPRCPTIVFAIFYWALCHQGGGVRRRGHTLGAAAVGRTIRRGRSPDGAKRNPGPALSIWHCRPRITLPLHPGYQLQAHPAPLPKCLNVLLKSSPQKKRSRANALL